MVDIAVPRNIDPRISQMEDIYLYTVDDLRDIIQENLQSRRDAAKQAEEIIDIQAEHFMAWLRAHNIGHAIRKLRSRAETVRDQAVEQAQRQLSNGKDPAEVLLHLAHGLTNKLMHNPSAGLREAGAQNRDDLVKAIKILYKLEDGEC
jgi:glutamyl-tRNA reductase